MDFNLYSKDFETGLWPCEYCTSDLESRGIYMIEVRKKYKALTNYNNFIKRDSYGRVVEPIIFPCTLPGWDNIFIKHLNLFVLERSNTAHGIPYLFLYSTFYVSAC